MIADALGARGVLPFRLPLPLLLVMGYMPTAAALIVTGMTRGKTGIRSLLGRLAIWRVGWLWYAFAVFGLALVLAAAILVYNWFAGPEALPLLAADAPQFSSPLAMAFNLVVLFLIVGLVNGEELAWRGFALPRLQARWNALASSLVLGVVWALFHLPLFLSETDLSQAGIAFASFTVSTLGMTVLYTWMYNHTRGSVLLAYLLHASANTWTQVFSIEQSNLLQGWILAGLMVALAAVVVWREGKEHLSRSGSRIQEQG
jgi:membrane protease YdiL (CAAX protease family)